MWLYGLLRSDASISTVNASLQTADKLHGTYLRSVWNRKPWLKGKTNRVRVQYLVSAVYVHSILHNSRAHYPRSYTKPLSCWTPWYFMTSALHSDEIKLEQHCIYHCASALWDLHRATRWGNSVKRKQKNPQQRLTSAASKPDFTAESQWLHKGLLFWQQSHY